MARRQSLEPWEGALIKAMWATGKFTKQQITAYFSRPARSINQARISQIIDGKMMKDVTAASEAQVRAFLSFRGDTAETRLKVLLADPLHSTAIDHVIKVDPKRKGHLAIKETDVVECKEKLDWDRRERFCRSMAGLANNKGGYILIGVKDKTFEIVGAEADKLGADPATITDYLNKTFVPSIVWDHTVLTYSGKSVVVVSIPPAAKKPVVCIQERNPGLDGITIGRVYFRYPGQTTEIRYGELEAIIKAREDQVQQRWEDIFSKIRAAGVENAAVLDVGKGKIEGPFGTVLIDEKLLPKLNFVREGEFTQAEGAPTLRLIGDVRPVSGPEAIARTVLQKANITDRDIVQDFIEQQAVSAPIEYVRHLCHTPTLWLPVFYYVRQAKLSNENAADVLKTEKTSLATIRRKQIERLLGKRQAAGSSLSADAKPVLATLKEKHPIKLETAKEAAIFLRAVRNLSAAEIDLIYLMPLMKTVFDRFYDSSLPGDIRYAACYLDAAVCGIPKTG